MQYQSLSFFFSAVGRVGIRCQVNARTKGRFLCQSRGWRGKVFSSSTNAGIVVIMCQKAIEDAATRVTGQHTVARQFW
jgi:hypothetical protein